MVVEFVADSLHVVLGCVFLFLFLIFFVDLLSNRQLEGLVQNRVEPVTALHLN